MTDLPELLDRVASLSVEAALNGLWPGLALAAAAECLLRLVRWPDAAGRYAIWSAVLLVVVALPLASVRSRRDTGAAGPGYLMDRTAGPSPSYRAEPLPKSHPTFLPGSGEEVDENGPSLTSAGMGLAGETAALARAETRSEGGPAALRLPLQIPSGRWGLLLFGGWLLVATGLMARLIWSYCGLERLKRKSSALSPDYQGRLNRWVREFGPDRPVGLHSSKEIALPLTAGFRHPLVVIPEELAVELSGADLDRVILHELAHLRRRDDWTNLCQKLIEAFFFYHPAVFWIGRRLNLAREIACDDWVVALTGEPRPYAACLTRLIEVGAFSRTAALSPGAAGSGKQIFRRIEMLLNRKSRVAPPLARMALLVSLGLVVVLLAMLTRISPVLAVRADREKETVPRQWEEERSKSEPGARPKTEPEQELESRLRAIGKEREHLQATARARAQEMMRRAAEQQQFAFQEQIRAAEEQLRAVQEQMSGALGGVRDGVAGGVRAMEMELAEAARGLSAVAETAKPPIPESELLPLLGEIARTDADPAVREAAVEAIGRYTSEAGSETLLQLYEALEDLELKKRVVAHLLRGGVANQKVLAKLAEIATRESDFELRKAAFRALGRASDDAGTEVLISIYDGSRDVETREAVLQYLNPHGSKKAAEKLVLVAQSDPDPKMRLLAVRRLAELAGWHGGGFGLVHPPGPPLLLEPPELVEAPEPPEHPELREPLKPPEPPGPPEAPKPPKRRESPK